MALLAADTAEGFAQVLTDTHGTLAKQMQGSRPSLRLRAAGADLRQNQNPGPASAGPLSEEKMRPLTPGKPHPVIAGGRSSSDLTNAASPLIDRFLDTIWAERGLSRNTIESYRSSLTEFHRSLSERNVPIELATRTDLLAYFAGRVKDGIRPASTRRLLTSLRQFYRYLVGMGIRETDPTDDIEMPKVGRALPKTLSESEVRHCSGHRIPRTESPL